jgi:transcriptional regulator with XRE-family HTH domain
VELKLKKAPDPIDRYVGHRVRVRRLLIGVSQEKLGDALGVTFQQIQKYEKGTNRISASRLQQIADMLGVPVGFFYEGAPRQEVAIEEERPNSGISSDLFWTSQDLQLVRAFQRVSSPQVRRRLIGLVESLVDPTETAAE